MPPETEALQSPGTIAANILNPVSTADQLGITGVDVFVFKIVFCSSWPSCRAYELQSQMCGVKPCLAIAKLGTTHFSFGVPLFLP